ncbi:methyltransferase [Vibrio sp. SCSIO 43137]|uniref:methyltransferase n=1 Tax=Vibrio sp. SCSIO 43137 TaxID=3021011 RepID=UPI002307E6EB|nr:methyltransferase [Vibrio sp. SCSIO 43137]WCE29076.1 methyltransferase [Vibrio sp. SCSIO 43137]
MSEVKTELLFQQRSLTLYRYPKRANDLLQAWDAGDEYLISHVEELQLAEGKNIVILNDQFGALSCWFSAKHNVTMVSDSFLACQGTADNLKLNQCNAITQLNALDDLPEKIDLVLFKLPKSNRLLTWQLSQLRARLDSNCPVIAVNKAKDIHSSTLKLFEKHLGTTQTSLAKKKHRLVFSKADSKAGAMINPVTEWQVDGENYHLKNYPNVYSGESLDLGARFMLNHIPSNDRYKHIIDLGCGNGVLSVKAAQQNPQAKITCVDESFMAVESAKLNLQAALGEEHNSSFVANNCLDGFAAESADLVLCNPPFHQQNAITDHIAWQMFCDAKHVLNNNGQLLVIGNRHLSYDNKLSRLFGKQQVKLIASNRKFVILQATK